MTTQELKEILRKVSLVRRDFELRLDQAHGELCLSAEQALILLGLAERPDQMIYFGTNSTYNISQLRKRGLLEQTASSTDKRYKHRRLTPKGELLVPALLKALSHVEA